MLLSASPRSAQYFGRNKVEYRDFDFQILATEHFDVYYYSHEERAARIAAQLAERWYARFSTLLNHQLRFAAAAGALRQPGRIRPDQCGVGPAAGLGRRRDRRIAPAHHHAVCADAGGNASRARPRDRPRVSVRHRAGTMAATPSQPLWFIEGMAEYLSRGSLDSESSLWLRDAVLSDRLPEKESAAARELSPYLYGHAFWAYLGKRFGDDVVEKALKPGKKQRRLKDRMQFATGEDARCALRRVARALCTRNTASARGRRPHEAVEPRTHAAWPVAQSRRHAGGVLLRARSPRRSTCSSPMSRPAA